MDHNKLMFLMTFSFHSSNSPKPTFTWESSVGILIYYVYRMELIHVLNSNGNKGHVQCLYYGIGDSVMLCCVSCNILVPFTDKNVK